MTHPRTRLRAAAVARLTGLTTTGPRVFVDREYTQQPTELPCLHLSVSESAQMVGYPATYARQIQLRVRALARVTASMSDTLDRIALEVETALGLGLSVGATAPLLHSGMSADDPDVDVGTDQPVGEQILHFQYTMHTEGTAPGVPI